MTIATYSDLQTAVENWLHRSDADLTARLPELIALAESRLVRVGLLRTQETRAALSTTAGQKTIALPSDFESPICCWVTINSVDVEIFKRDPEDFGRDSSQGLPSYWAIDGTNILFDRAADQIYAIPFRYVARYALSNSNTTNYLLTNAPDVYLFATLAEVCVWANDDDRLAVFEQRAQRAIDEQNHIESKSRKAPLRTDLAEIGKSGWRFNVYRGF